VREKQANETKEATCEGDHIHASPFVHGAAAPASTKTGPGKSGEREKEFSIFLMYGEGR
jgi:hypothetical protein